MSFIDDLKVVGKLTEEQTTKIVGCLNSSEKVSSKYLTENPKFYKSTSLPEEVGKPVLRVIIFLTDVSIDEKGIDAGFLEVEKNFKEFFDGDNEVIGSWDKAKSILRNLEPFSLSRKTLHLKTKFPHLHDFALVCDARPIFNTSRSEIKRMTYPVLMKLEDHEGKDMVFELDEDKLRHMTREIETALMKIELLKKSFSK